MTDSGSLQDVSRFEPELPSLPDELAPPADLEDAVVSGLARHGLLGRNPRRARWWPVATAAALLVLGYSAGRWSVRPAPAEDGSSFVLLLEETSATVPMSPEIMQQHVDENREWAQRLAADGRLVMGEKLATGGWAVTLDSGNPTATALAPSPEEVGGFFVILAADLDEALTVARGAPHVAYGGRVVVRPVDPT